MKLDIGTSLNLVFDPSYKKPITQQLDSVCGAGFKHIDMNFLDWCHGENRHLHPKTGRIGYYK